SVDASSALGTATTTDGGITWTIPILANISGFSDATGSLVDGIYRATLHASMLSGFSGTDTTTEFHRLFGDLLGSKTVNNANYLRFLRAYNTSTGDTNYNANFDYQANGTINNADYLQFRSRYGKVFTY